MSLENQKLHVAEVIHGADMEIHNIVLRHSAKSFRGSCMDGHGTGTIRPF